MKLRNDIPTVGAAVLPPATLIAPNSAKRPKKSEPKNTDIADHLRPAARDSALKPKDTAAPSTG
jgi:hypothetical protein